jgi:hypothetical protein
MERTSGTPSRIPSGFFLWIVTFGNGFSEQALFSGRKFPFLSREEKTVAGGRCWTSYPGVRGEGWTFYGKAGD